MLPFSGNANILGNKRKGMNHAVPIHSNVALIQFTPS